MWNFFNRFATENNRWIALVFLAMGLAIVIIDNTVLNVAIPYILRDLNTSFDSIQWVVSGYALLIATVMITVGRLGDLIGRKKVFMLGTVLFAIGSFIASIAPNIFILFLGEALIEALGAAMMMTSSLSLLVSEFHGRERSIAFGVWGSVAGAAAAIGPLLGGFLTAYYSWRWALRINVFVALAAILGSMFIMESRGQDEKTFDWWGTLFSGVGLFSLIFGFIEGQKFGWFTPKTLTIWSGFTWPFHSISIIPVAFVLSVIFLILFAITELRLEKQGKSPLLRLSMFKNMGFATGIATLGILSLGQFGTFFVLPIYMQNVLGFDAFKTGLVFLPASIAILIVGPLSGFVSSKVGPRWIVSGGMFILALGTFILSRSLATDSNWFTLAPGLILLGAGVGASGAQLTNIILSSVPIQLAGEASAANSTIRQVGTSIGIAVLGLVLATNITSYTNYHVSADWKVPNAAKDTIITSLNNVTLEAGQKPKQSNSVPKFIGDAVKTDVKASLTDASSVTLNAAFMFVVLGAIFSLLIPNNPHHGENPWKKQEENTESEGAHPLPPREHIQTASE